MRVPSQLRLVAAALLIAQRSAAAQVPNHIAATTRDLHAQIAAMQRAEREVMPAAGTTRLQRASDDVLARRDRARARIARDLDSLLAAGPAGRVAIRRAATAFPSVDLVRRAEIRAAVLAGAFGDASRLIDRLQATMPRDTQLVRWRADIDDALGRDADALRARQAYWELAPEDDGAWRALVRAHERAGSLARLRESVARLRILHPTSTIVRDEEIEVLHRLGRYDEAARVAAAARGDSR